MREIEGEQRRRRRKPELGNQFRLCPLLPHRHESFLGWSCDGCGEAGEGGGAVVGGVETLLTTFGGVVSVSVDT